MIERSSGRLRAFGCLITLLAMGCSGDPSPSPSPSLTPGITQTPEPTAAQTQPQETPTAESPSDTPQGETPTAEATASEGTSPTPEATDGNGTPVTTENPDTPTPGHTTPTTGAGTPSAAQPTPTAEGSASPDADGDGFSPAQGDCDDDNAQIHPDADEICDEAGVDENCNDLSNDDDPQILESSQTTYYHDVDRDGFGAPGDSMLACDDPTTSSDWWTEVAGDCQDRDEDIHPEAQEHCDGKDEDCDDGIDESPVDGSLWYVDSDGDGYGVENQSTRACEGLADHADTPGDCDDALASINPGAMEICDPNGVDENCNGLENDEDETIDPTTQGVYYPDVDGDGYGDDEANAQYFCVAPTGMVTIQGDCDDGDDQYHPGADELCTGEDDFNCDGSVGDEDADGDGSPACEDCDDGDASIHPDALEKCDDLGIDENCNGLLNDDDENIDFDSQITFYYDGDLDGYGSDSVITVACSQPEGYSTLPTDCNDDDANFNPAAGEVCDGDATDEDCDGTINCLDADCADADICADFTCETTDIGSALGEVYSGNTLDDENTFTGACGGEGAKDEALSWVAPESGYYLVDTAGSNFDTILSVRADDCRGEELVCNDESIGAQSALYFYADGGSTYLFIVDGWGDSEGEFIVNIAFHGEEPPDETPTPYETPTPETVDISCADYDLGDAVGRDLASGSTAGAGDDYADTCFGQDDEEIIYAWQAPETSSYRITLEADVDGVLLSTLTVYPGQSCPSDGLYFCGESYTEMPYTEYLNIHEGEVFLFVVGAKSDAPANYHLSIEAIEQGYCDDEIDNDKDGSVDCDDSDCANAIACLDEVCDNGVDDDYDYVIDCQDSECFDDPACDGPRDCGDYHYETDIFNLSASTADAENRYAGFCADGESGPDVMVSWLPQTTGYFSVLVVDEAVDHSVNIFRSELGDECPGYEDQCTSAFDRDDAPLYLYAYASETVNILVDSVEGSAGDFELWVAPSEYYECEDGVDNDGDGLTDCEDDDCVTNSACIAEVCDDGTDNDGDFFTDCLDDECADDEHCAAFTCPEISLPTSTETIIHSGTTVGADDYFTTSCGGDGSGDITFDWQPETSGYYRISTLGSELDTILTIFNGGCGGYEETCQGGESGTALVLWADSSMEGYMILIDGHAQQEGAYTLTIEYLGTDAPTPTPTPTPEPIQVDCVDEDLGSTLGDGIFTGSLAGAGDELSANCSGDGAADLLFSWTAPMDGYYRLNSKGSEMGLNLELYEPIPGGACADLGYWIDCSISEFADQPSAVEFWSEADRMWFFLLEGDGESEAAIQLNLSMTEQGHCEDDVDNDNDGWTDCQDSDCEGSLACRFEFCDDGIDNDDDYKVDCQDPDCMGAGECPDEKACADVDLGSAVGAGLFTDDIEVYADDFQNMCSNQYGADVALTWQPPTAGVYEISTEGSALSVSMSVFLEWDAAACAESLWSCSESVLGESSSVAWLELVGDETILIIVDDYLDMGGEVTVNISLED